MKLLLLVNNLDVVNGITTFIYYQSKVLIENYKYEIYIISAGGDDYERFRKLGVKLISKEFLSFERRSYFKFILSILFCLYFILKHRIDIINPQIHYTAAYSYIPSKLLKRSYIQTVHDILLNPGRLRFLYGKHFFAINKLTMSYIDKSVRDSTITLIRCPFEIVDNTILKQGKLKIVTSGRLVKEKSFDVYFNAIAQLKKIIRDKADFYITGAGEYEEELIRLADKLKIIVEFKGIVHDINLIYKETHIFVMSTGNVNEGLGLGIIQAALNKNLIITPDYYSIKELFIGDKDGLLFGLGSSEELASRLEYAIENYEKMKPLIDNFYEKIKNEFSHEKNGKIINTTYISML